MTVSPSRGVLRLNLTTKAEGSWTESVLNMSLQVGEHCRGLTWRGLDSIKSICPRQSMHGWQSHWLWTHICGKKWSSAHLHSNSVTTPSYGIDDYDDNNSVEFEVKSLYRLRSFCNTIFLLSFWLCIKANSYYI